MNAAPPKIRILLVDDDPAVRAFISMVLSEFGYRVCQACDCREALLLTEELQRRGDRPDLLFTELNMQPMSGLELAGRVRASGLDVPVLVAGGFIYDADFEALQRLARHRFLVKPFKTQEMLQYIGELTGGVTACRV